MNIASKILTVAIGVGLVACDASTQRDIARAADASHSQLVKTQEEESRTADAHAAASREINGAALKSSMKQARADYGKAIAQADRELSDALKKCGLVSARVSTACEADARAIREQAAEKAKMRLSFADQ